MDDLDLVCDFTSIAVLHNDLICDFARFGLDATGIELSPQMHPVFGPVLMVGSFFIDYHI